MKVKIKNIPKVIYLNVGEIYEDEIEFSDLREVTWCEDKIGNNDIKYKLVKYEVKQANKVKEKA